MTQETKRYLGDAVYAQIVEGMILLTTEDGAQVTNEIFLEDEVIRELTKYIKQWFENMI